MAKVFDFNWQCSVSLSRDQVKALGRLAEFVGNLESDYKKEFPSTAGTIKWDQVRSAFGEFARMNKKDSQVLTELNVLVSSVNSGVNKEVKQ